MNEDTDEAEYRRIQRDLAEGRRYGVLDTSGIRDASIEVGREWAGDPNKTLRGMVRLLIVAPVVAGIAGAGVALFVGPAWLPSGPAWGLGVGGLIFWLAGLLTWSQLLGATIVRRQTRRGFLVWLFLTVVLPVMAWVFVLGPGLSNLT